MNRFLMYFSFDIFVPGVTERLPARDCLQKVQRTIGHMSSLSGGCTAHTKQASEFFAVCKKSDGKSAGMCFRYCMHIFFVCLCVFKFVFIFFGV